MEFLTVEGYDVGFLKGVDVVAVRIILGGNEGAGTVLEGGSFQGESDGNLQGEDNREGDPLGVSKVTEYGTRQATEGKVLVTIHGATDRSELGGDKG